MITEYPVTTSARYHAFTWNVLVPAQYGAIAAIRQTPSLANSGWGLDISAGHSTRLRRQAASMAPIASPSTVTDRSLTLRENCLATYTTKTETPPDHNPFVTLRFVGDDLD